jgi:thioredoxin reductase (NADPH)
MYDTIIIGSGAAGLSAAIYAKRSGLDFVVFEKNAMSGGQMAYANEIENYPAFENISGFELATKMRRHAEKLGAKFISAAVTELVQMADKTWKISAGGAKYLTKTVIYAAGAEHKTLGADGEKKFTGRGVSYCAICDGGFYRNKTTAVIGGGNTALQDALYLAKLCQKVYLVHRRDEFRGHRHTAEKVRSTENIELILNSSLKKINGNSKVEEIILENNSGTVTALKADGVFMAVGIQPINEIVKGFVKMDKNGFIVTNEECFTGTAGLFAAGDVRSKKHRQIITAAADGAIAAEAVNEYLG